MLDDVGKAAIERYKHAAFSCGDGEESVVRRADKLLITSKCHVMARLPKGRPNRVGNVLVQLDRGHD